MNLSSFPFLSSIKGLTALAVFEEDEGFHILVELLVGVEREGIRIVLLSSDLNLFKLDFDLVEFALYL